MRSKYLAVKDGLIRMFVRFLYTKFLDELYIPSGTTAHVVRKSMIWKKQYGHIDCIRLSTPTLGYKNRRGMMETILTDVTEDSTSIEYKTQNFFK